MTKLIQLLALTFSILTATPTFGAIITLCNEVGISADYNNFTDAQANANVGDTIYFYPSKNNYGALTVTKTLTLLGPGNLNSKKASTGNITINEEATDSKIVGMDIQEITCSASNVIFAKNTIFQLTISSSANNCIVKQNNFDTRKSSSDDVFSIDCSADNIFIQNNYVSAIKCSSNTIATIKNNKIEGYGYYNYKRYFITVNNSMIHSNYYYGQYRLNFDYYTPTFIVGNNNDESSNTNTDSESILSIGSYPYTAQPSIPTITNVNIPDIVNSEGKLEISFDVSVNN